MDEVEDPGIPVDNIADDQRQLEEKAKLEVRTFRESLNSTVLLNTYIVR